MLRDEQRSAYLMSRGYRVLRFWSNDVLRDIKSVMEALYSVLQESEQFTRSAEQVYAPHPDHLRYAKVIDPPRQRAGGWGARCPSVP
jgi:Protein of unknown function (DUF559)